MKYLGLFPDVPGLQGCSDGGCVFRPPTGMHTNGGCACMKRGADPLRLQLNLQRISRHMESMRAERDALAKDAARYRWLRRNCQYGFEDHDGPQLIHRNGETGPHQNARWREDLDAAIDAEMEKQP